ncbi:oxidase [Marinivivus vitaminiproducens]|uniref:oxidase n=1 Tax=Marinivivus vitaminiproducens TaxID=3035935 RepID=UPI002798A31F|nr:hypothetical protein P4R82_10585 [Geminicoccaceae bacterium SCSIO 64248]
MLSYLRQPHLREARLVYASLIGLLAVNLMVVHLPIGVFRPILLLAVAAIQAGITLWLSMEVKRQPPLIRLYAFLGSFFVLAMITLTLNDYLGRPILAMP